MRYTKYGWSLLFILSLLTGGCNKRNGEGTGSILGSWELRQSSGGMMPGADSYAPGNGNIVEFKDDNYKIYKSGQLIMEGQFSIIPDTGVEESVCLLLPKGQYANRIDYTDSSSRRIFFQLDGDMLGFYSGCYAYDAGTHQVYQRMATSPGQQ